MKSDATSSAIIVVAAAILLAGGVQGSTTDSKSFALLLGFILGVMGLAGWITSVRNLNDSYEKNDPRE